MDEADLKELKERKTRQLRGLFLYTYDRRRFSMLKLMRLEAQRINLRVYFLPLLYWEAFCCSLLTLQQMRHGLPGKRNL